LILADRGPSGKAADWKVCPTKAYWRQAGKSAPQRDDLRAFGEGERKVIEFESMRAVLGISAAILLLLTFLVAVPALGQDSGKTGSSRLSERSVQQAMARLTEGGGYEYDEATLEEPIWLLRIKEWLNSLSERWDRSPGSIVSQADPVEIVSIFAVVVLVIMLLILLPRIVEWRARRLREGALGGRR
jgi:hypothetical protein